MRDDKDISVRFAAKLDCKLSFIANLTDMINQAYDDGESGMWQHAGTRTNRDEVEHLIQSGALMVAEITDGLVGSVSINLMGRGVGGFGMLVAAPTHRALGVGSALVNHAEHWARTLNCHTMQLELLTPRRWLHPNKEFLKTWYTRVGYRTQSTKPFEAMYPKLASLLATDCDFTVWQKPLA